MPPTVADVVFLYPLKLMSPQDFLRELQRCVFIPGREDSDFQLLFLIMEQAKALWAPFAGKYSIHEETYQFAKKSTELDNKPYSEIGVEIARQQALASGLAMCKEVNFSGQETEIVVPSPYNTEGIPISIYKPQNCAEVPAIWIYFHGGGLVIGSRRTVESALKTIATGAGAIVINVEYRLLPIAHAPCAPLDDGVAVTRWIMDNKSAVGGKERSAVGVGGDSAGGHISASITNEVAGLDFQVLVYPMTDTSRKQASFQEFENAPVLGKGSIDWFFDNSIKLMPHYLTDPRINPMARTTAELSPAALFILAEMDPLVGAGLDYAQKLRHAGVSVQCEIIKGVPHAFFPFDAVFIEKTSEAYAHVIKFLNQFQHSK
ncbi:G protein-activated inward rectifier potassium channel 2 [Plakobranchus ocellatus]|uniref:G protein-activated inward rectifier potassium channel 2 n=1 Tax=Plakobranchus ocellatus TaxID=259542 RepID=A0AAV4DQ71_9GAST|nr:G protein-activated inward rectifier potassium channel 2 [Plakobranchus ocellatus]